MMKELDKLNKTQLKELAKDLLLWHENHYNRVNSKLKESSEAFFELSGNIQSIRIRNNLPRLY